jgi:hypothetical protein
MMLTIAALALSCALSPQDSKKDQLRSALKDDAVKGDWNYDDLSGGYAEAMKTGKPMMVVFR